MAYFVRVDNDLAPGAAAVSASTEVAPYLATNAVLDNPAKPWKASAPTGWIQLEFANKIQPVGAAMIYAYLLAGLNVRLQASATGDFSSPNLDFAFTIPAKRKDGPSFQRWTINPWILLTDPSEWDDPDGYKFWRFIVVGTNDQNVIIGKVMLFSAIDHVDLLASGGEIGREKDYDEFSAIRDRTELGVRKVVVLGGPRRFLSMTWVGTDDTAGTAPVQEAEDFRLHLQAAEGDAHPWLFIPWDHRNDAWLVDVEDFSWERAHNIGGYQTWSVAVREVSRGIPFP